MNNDPTPTSPADPDPNSNRHHDEDDDADDNASEEQQNGSVTNTQRQRPDLSQKAKDGLSKKLTFLIHLLLSLDTLVYAELCVLYYMEYVLSILSGACMLCRTNQCPVLAVPSSYS
jgi:hypothetical protein